jgi:hypothetical protein
VSTIETTKLNFLLAPLGYLGALRGVARYRVYPPSSGRLPEEPPKEYHEMRIYDCRPVYDELDLDRHGFVVRQHTSAIQSFFDDADVRAHYYPEIEALVKKTTGAQAVLVFSHTVRSAEKAADGLHGVLTPVDIVHDDYTEESGRRRIRELLEAHGLSHLSHHRAALINAWRPINGPVQDLPLAVCDAQSVSPAELVPTDVEHLAQQDLPAARDVREPYSPRGQSQPPSPAFLPPWLEPGQVYSLRHNPRHRWFYISNMQPSDVLMFKCYDSLTEGVARFTPHSSFANPECPVEFVPRESIEARTIVIYPRA